MLPDVQVSGRRVTGLDANATSVVLWVELGFENVLLGGDLESRDDPSRGWQEICESRTRPPGLAGLFKVPHHGSITGHHEPNYTKLLASHLAVLTPFKRGKVSLPTDNDRARICSYADAGYSTVVRPQAKPIKFGSVIMKQLREMNVVVQPADPECGHVRLRRRASEGGWRVELGSMAGSIC